MTNIKYDLKRGKLSITVYLKQGETIIDSNVHTVYEKGQFDNIPAGNYTLEFVDSLGCIETETITPGGCGYGLLYNWWVGTDAKNIAPNGWRMPTVADFDTLATYLGGVIGASAFLKETGTIYWESPNSNATNSTGFNGRGCGYRLPNGNFLSINTDLYIWTSVESNSSEGYDVGMISADEFFRVGPPPISENKKFGFSIRLIKNDNINIGTMTGNDGKIYSTTKIGDQVWLAQNLAETRYADGSLIPEVTDNTEWNNLTTGAVCAYNNDWNYACLSDAPECGGLIQCNCEPVLSYSANTVAVIQTGELSGCDFYQYVIKWYNSETSELAFTSGKNKSIDNSIDVQHPINFPINAGTYIGELEYIILNGDSTKIYTTENRPPCEKYCTGLTFQLAVINVSGVTCGYKNTTGDYDYKIYYNATQIDTKDKEYEINLTSETGYVALKFVPYDVSDTISVYYNDETEPMLRYSVGQDNDPTNSPSTIKLYNTNEQKIIVNLSGKTYQDGDYLRIKIDASSNPNTNWECYSKCLPINAFSGDTEYFTPSGSTGLRNLSFSNISCVWEQTNCRYNLSWNMPNPLSSNFYSSNLAKYETFRTVFSGEANSSNRGTHNATTGLVNFYFTRREWLYSTIINTHSGNYTRSVLPYYTYEYDNTTHTMKWTIPGTPSGENYYNIFKSYYESFYARHINGSPGSHNDAYVNDPTNFFYYKFFTMSWNETMIGCGDNMTYRNIYFHHNCPVTFNNTGSGLEKTIIVQYIEIPFSMSTPPPVSCNNVEYEMYNWAQKRCQESNNSYNSISWSGQSNCSQSRVLNSYDAYSAVTYQNDIFAYSTYGVALKNLIDNIIPTNGWYEKVNNDYVEYLFYFFNLKVDFIDENNYTIYSDLDFTTGYSTGTWTQVYPL